MYSSTPSLDSSLVLNDSGSSNTSPSRLPRMFVEYQPARPSIRALKAGASTVFIIGWPDIEVLPPGGRRPSSGRRWWAGVYAAGVGHVVASGPLSVWGACVWGRD